MADDLKAELKAWVQNQGPEPDLKDEFQQWLAGQELPTAVIAKEPPLDLAALKTGGPSEDVVSKGVGRQGGLVTGETDEQRLERIREEIGYVAPHVQAERIQRLKEEVGYEEGEGPQDTEQLAQFLNMQEQIRQNPPIPQTRLAGEPPDIEGERQRLIEATRPNAQRFEAMQALDQQFPGGTIGALPPDAPRGSMALESEDDRNLFQRITGPLVQVPESLTASFGRGLSALLEYSSRLQGLDQAEEAFRQTGAQFQRHATGEDAAEKAAGFVGEMGGYLIPSAVPMLITMHAAESANRTFEETGSEAAALGSGVISALGEYGILKLAGGKFGRGIYEDVGRALKSGNTKQAAQSIVSALQKTGGGVSAGAGIAEVEMALDRLQRVVTADSPLAEEWEQIKAATPETLMSGALTGGVIAIGGAVHAYLRTRGEAADIRRRVESSYNSLRNNLQRLEAAERELRKNPNNQYAQRIIRETTEQMAIDQKTIIEAAEQASKMGWSAEGLRRFIEPKKPKRTKPQEPTAQEQTDAEGRKEVVPVQQEGQKGREGVRQEVRQEDVEPQAAQEVAPTPERAAPTPAAETGAVRREPWERSDLATSPNIPIGRVQARKQADGSYRLTYRGTDNEVFPGERFKSASEARSFFKVQQNKAQQAQEQPDATTVRGTEEEVRQEEGGEDIRRQGQEQEGEVEPGEAAEAQVEGTGTQPPKGSTAAQPAPEEIDRMGAGTVVQLPVVQEFRERAEQTDEYKSLRSLIDKVNDKRRNAGQDAYETDAINLLERPSDYYREASKTAQRQIESKRKVLAEAMNVPGAADSTLRWSIAKGEAIQPAPASRPERSEWGVGDPQKGGWRDIGPQSGKRRAASIPDNDAARQWVKDTKGISIARDQQDAPEGTLRITYGGSNKRLAEHRELLDGRFAEQKAETATPEAQGESAPSGGEAGGGLNSPMLALDAPPSPNTQTASRIQPDPIRRKGDPKPISRMIVDLSKGLGKRVRVAKPSRNAAGTYYPGSARTVIRFAGDLSTTAHEISHRLDDLYGIVAEWALPRGYDKLGRALPQKSPFDDELRQDIFQQTTTKRMKVVQKRAEGVAEWIRAWIINPSEAERLAPKFASLFKDKVPAQARKRLRSFGDDIRQWAGLSALERTAANVELELTPTRLTEKAAGLIGRDGSLSDEFRLHWLTGSTNAVVNDTLAPVWAGIEYVRKLRGIEDQLPRQDTKILVRNFAGFDRKFHDVMNNGPVTATLDRIEGMGGFDWLIEPLDTGSRTALDEDLKILSAYMISERVAEKALQLDDAVTKVASLSMEVQTLRDAIQESKDPVERKEVVAQIRDLNREIKKTMQKAGYKGPPKRFPNWANLKKQRLAGTGGGLYDDTAQAKQSIKELEGIGEDRANRIREAALRYREWADAFLRYARDKGRISDEQYRAIKESNQFYVSMQRVFEELDPEMFRVAGKKLGSVSSVVQRFRGSTRPIQNIYVSLIQQGYSIMRESDRNEAINSFVDLLRSGRAMYEGEAIDLDQVGSLAKAGDKNTVRVFKDGKEEYWQFQEDIYNAIKGIGEQSRDHWLLKTVQFAFARVPHAAITYSPPFVIRNFLRDPLYRAVVSNTGSKPWGQLFFLKPKGIHEFNSALSDFYKYGGGMFGHYRQSKENYYKELKRLTDEMVNDGKTILSFPSRIAHGYAEMSKYSETIGRLAEYRKAYKVAKQKGYSDYDAGLYAAYEARSIQDYAVAGSLTKEINKYLIFTSAAWRGIAKTTMTTMKHPIRTMARWMGYVLLMELANLWWNARDDEELEEWRQQPAYLRDYFWNYKIGDDLWLRIPKPWELGVLASGVSRAIDEQALGNEDAWDGYLGSAARGVLPVDETAVAGPFRSVVEIATNYDFFRQKRIVSPFEENLDLELRKGTEHASRAGQLLQKMIGVDARYIDHFIESQLGGLGRMAIKTTDLGREDKPGLPDLGREASGILVRSPGYAARDVQWVLDWSRRRGKASSRQIRELYDQISAYFESDDPSERDALAKELRQQASELRQYIEQHGDLPSRSRTPGAPRPPRPPSPPKLPSGPG